MDGVTRKPPEGRPQHGFTLLEVMIAMTILAVGLLALLMAQAQAITDGSRGRHTQTAAAVARDQMERIQRMPFGDAALQPTSWGTPPWIPNDTSPLAPGEVPVRVTAADGTSTEMVYTVNYRVQADPGGNVDLRQVDLEVTWTEEGMSNAKPTRTGFPTAALSTVLVDNDR